jgi:hypothetical protein
MRGLEKAKPILPGTKLFSIGQGLRRAAGYHIVDTHQFADETTYRRCGRRERLPFREGAAFIGFEMTEADPSDSGGRQQRGHSVPHDWKQSFHTRVKQQGLLVAHEKLIELEIRLRNKCGDAIHIGGDFRDLGHRFFSHHFY